MRRAFALLAALLFAGPSFADESPAAFDAATTTWSREAMAVLVTSAKDIPLEGEFIGSGAGMQRYEGAQWAWFADGFDPAAYATIAVADARNSLGRYHVTGQDLFRDDLVGRLNRVKAWKKKVTAGADADLVLFVNIRAYKVTMMDVDELVEVLAVDRAGNIQAKLQVRAGTSGTGEMIAGAIMNGGVGLAQAIPSEKDQFEYLLTASDEAAARVAGAFAAYAREFSKGKAPSGGPAVALPNDRAWYVDPMQESFGAALQEQVATMLAVVQDPSASTDDRRDRAKDLGKIGASAVVPAFIALLGADDTPRKLREDIVWALGEIGHPDALEAIAAARGVGGKTKKYATTKITAY